MNEDAITAAEYVDSLKRKIEALQKENEALSKSHNYSALITDSLDLMHKNATLRATLEAVGKMLKDINTVSNSYFDETNLGRKRSAAFCLKTSKEALDLINKAKEVKNG